MLRTSCSKLAGRFLQRQFSTAAAAKPKCFLDISIDGKAAGRMEFELAWDVVPKTAENFRALCTGEKGFGYANSKSHRIIPGFMMQAGDIIEGDGTGGKSIYGDDFKDENFKIDHTKKGQLSMANCGPNTNASQFFVTMDACPWLDGKHVVFGQLTKGTEVLDMVEKVGTEEGAPTKPVMITNSGEVKQDSEEVKQD